MCGECVNQRFDRDPCLSRSGGEREKATLASLATNQISDLGDDDLLEVVELADVRWAFDLLLAIGYARFESRVLGAEPQIARERDSVTAACPSLRRFESTLFENFSVLLKCSRAMDCQCEVRDRALVEFALRCSDCVESRARNPSLELFDPNCKEQAGCVAGCLADLGAKCASAFGVQIPKDALDVRFREPDRKFLVEETQEPLVVKLAEVSDRALVDDDVLVFAYSTVGREPLDPEDVAWLKKEFALFCVQPHSQHRELVAECLGFTVGGAHDLAVDGRACVEQSPPLDQHLAFLVGIDSDVWLAGGVQHGEEVTVVRYGDRCGRDEGHDRLTPGSGADPGRPSPAAAAAA